MFGFLPKNVKFIPNWGTNLAFIFVSLPKGKPYRHLSLKVPNVECVFDESVLSQFLRWKFDGRICQWRQLSSWHLATLLLWKKAGQPRSPIVEVIHSNCPIPSTVKAARCRSPEWMGICQHLEVRWWSQPFRCLFDAFIDLFHGVFVNVGVSNQDPEVLHNSESWPSFLGTQKMGEL